MTTAAPMDIEVDQLRTLNDGVGNSDRPRLPVQAVLLGLVDASGGKSKFVLHAADPAAQIYFCACGQEPEVARAGLESAVELLARLRASEKYATHVVPLLFMNATVAVFHALTLMRIKMEPRRCGRIAMRAAQQSRSVVTSRR